MSNLMTEALMSQGMGTISVEKEETTPEIENLRKLRNEYNDKASEIQQQIDQKFLELHDVPKFNKQWVLYNRADGGRTLLGFVTDIKRLYRGFRIYFSELFQEDAFGLSVVNLTSEIFNWDQVGTDFKIISEKEVFEKINKTFSKYIEKCHHE